MRAIWATSHLLTAWMEGEPAATPAKIQKGPAGWVPRLTQQGPGLAQRDGGRGRSYPGGRARTRARRGGPAALYLRKKQPSLQSATAASTGGATLITSMPSIPSLYFLTRVETPSVSLEVNVSNLKTFACVKQTQKRIFEVMQSRRRLISTDYRLQWSLRLGWHVACCLCSTVSRRIKSSQTESTMQCPVMMQTPPSPLAQSTAAQTQSARMDSEYLRFVRFLTKEWWDQMICRVFAFCLLCQIKNGNVDFVVLLYLCFFWIYTNRLTTRSDEDVQVTEQ